MVEGSIFSEGSFIFWPKVTFLFFFFAAVAGAVSQNNRCGKTPQEIADWLPLPDFGPRYTIVGGKAFAEGTASRVFLVEKTVDGAPSKHYVLRDARPGHEHELELDSDHLARVYPRESKMHEYKGRYFNLLLFHPYRPGTLELPHNLHRVLFCKEENELFSKFSYDQNRDPDFIEKLSWKIMREMARIHKTIVKEKGTVHADVKPENIILFFDESGEVQIRFVDFAYATELGEFHPNATVYGTPEYSCREMWEGKQVTFVRDVRNIQRIGLQMRVRKHTLLVKTNKGFGVKREVAENDKLHWKDPGKIYDDQPDEINPNLAMVLGGHIPVDMETLMEMSEEAKRPDFIKLYANRWYKAFVEGAFDLERRSELIYELVIARKLGPEIFKEVQLLAKASGFDVNLPVSLELKFRQEWLASPASDKNPEWGWHNQTGPAIDSFSAALGF